MIYVNANDLYIDVLQRLLDRGLKSSPRGMPIRELLNVQLQLTVPQSSIVGLGARRLNYHFMVGEALWMLSGLNRADLIEPFNRNIVMALDEGMPFFQGAYGPKIIDQLGYIYEVLREDPDSRQAVLTIWRERPRRSKDVPCTVMMQFMLRHNQLHMHTYMRSNDAWLGLPYDLFNFTLIQQVVACELGAELGIYTHTVGSLHLYERNEEAAATLVTTLGGKRIDAMMNRVHSLPLNLVTGAYAEAAVLKHEDGVMDWLERWESRILGVDCNDCAWTSMLTVLAHRFDPKVEMMAPWSRLEAVGR